MAHTLINEVKRIEHKYSRYQDDLIIGLINNALGKPTPLDVETRGLLNLADILWQQSAGVFDISSGVLRNVWGFSAPIKVNDDCPFPSTKTIDDWMQYVGWDKVHLTENNITMHSDMQIDLGSIGNHSGGKLEILPSPE